MIANKHLTPHRGQHLSVVPRRVRHQMMQRLMRAANIVGSQSCRQRLDTLTFSRQQQSGAVVLQWSMSICVPRGVSQTLNICREAPLLWAWRGEA